MQLPSSSLFSGLCIGHHSSTGPLDEDLDALWAADKREASLQKVNSLNAPHKVNNCQAYQLSSYRFQHPGDQAWNKGHSTRVWRLEVQDWACWGGRKKGGFCPPGWISGKICQAWATQSLQLFTLTNPKPNTHHPRGWGLVSLQSRWMFSGGCFPADVFRRLHWGFLEKLEDVTSNLTNNNNKKTYGGNPDFPPLLTWLSIALRLLHWPRAHASFQLVGIQFLWKLSEISRLTAGVSNPALRLTL